MRGIYQALCLSGCLSKVALRRLQKSITLRQKTLYAAIDGSDFYHNTVNPNHRSIMNVPFHLADDSLDKRFFGRIQKKQAC